jgi:hypothetical protein
VITAVPALTPVTTPVLSPTVAIAKLPLTQVPPVTPFANVVVAPAHIEVVPVIAVGDKLTIIVAVA